MANQDSWPYHRSDILDSKRTPWRSVCPKLLSHSMESWVPLLYGTARWSFSISYLPWIFSIFYQGWQALWSAVSAFCWFISRCAIQYSIILTSCSYSRSSSRSWGRRIRPYFWWCPYLWESYRADERTDVSYSTPISMSENWSKSPVYWWTWFSSYYTRMIWSWCTYQGSDGGGWGDGGER